MSEAREESEWTWDAYLEWESRQPVRHELVDGQVHAMGGGTAEHDAIGNNLRGELRDYEATESIKYYVLISQEEPLVQVYRRDELGRFGVRSAVVLEGMDASIDLPDFGVSIPFGALYEGVQFPEGSGFSRRLLAARGRTRRGGVDAPR